MAACAALQLALEMASRASSGKACHGLSWCLWCLLPLIMASSEGCTQRLRQWQLCEQSKRATRSRLARIQTLPLAELREGPRPAGLPGRQRASTMAGGSRRTTEEKAERPSGTVSPWLLSLIESRRKPARALIDS